MLAPTFRPHHPRRGARDRRAQRGRRLERVAGAAVAPTGGAAGGGRRVRVRAGEHAAGRVAGARGAGGRGRSRETQCERLFLRQA